MMSVINKLGLPINIPMIFYTGLATARDEKNI